PPAAARQIAACGKVIWLWACVLKLRILPRPRCAGLPVPFGAKFARACFPWPIGMCYGYHTVRTEWEARRAQCGVSGREHVRGRITVPQGDASGLFSPYAQFTWWIDRYGTRSFAAGVRILCTEYGDTAVHVSCFGRGWDRRGRWFAARPRSARFLWRHSPRATAGLCPHRLRRGTRGARFRLWPPHGPAAVLVCPFRPPRRRCPPRRFLPSGPAPDRPKNR